MGLIIYLISYILKRIFFSICVVYSSFYYFLIVDFKGLDNYFFKLAISNDQLGNVAGGVLFNHLFIYGTKAQFGNPDETISSVLGKNKITNSLTLSGRLLAFILDKIEKDHVIKSIKKEC